MGNDSLNPNAIAKRATIIVGNVRITPEDNLTVEQIIRQIVKMINV